MLSGKKCAWHVEPTFIPKQKTIIISGTPKKAVFAILATNLVRRKTNVYISKFV
jgi:hypothetical protein